MIKRTSTNNNFESKHKDNPEILYGYYNGLKDITNAIITLATEDGISEKEIRDILNSGESELNTKLSECKDKINHQVTKTAFKLEDVTITVTANGNSEYLKSRVNLISTIIQNLFGKHTSVEGM